MLPDSVVFADLEKALPCWSLLQAIWERWPPREFPLSDRQGEHPGQGGFLGFDFRRVRSLRGRWRPQYTPKLTQRTALLGKLKELFRRYDSQSVGRVITEINPILRGWVNYFRIGNSGRCFAYVMNWVEKKVRRHLMRARNRAGFGWTRWSTAALYTTLELFGLFRDYHVRYGART